MIENWLFLTIYASFWVFVLILMAAVAWKKYKTKREKTKRRAKLWLIKGENIEKVRSRY